MSVEDKLDHVANILERVDKRVEKQGQVLDENLPRFNTLEAESEAAQIDRARIWKILLMIIAAIVGVFITAMM